MTTNYGIVVYSKASGEILRFIPCDEPVTAVLTASFQESLKHEIQEPFFVSPASFLMCKFYSADKWSMR